MKLILFFFLMSFVINGFGQTARPFPMEEKALLWEIKGDGVKNRSFIFGTMHLIKEEFFYFPDDLKKIVSKSKQLTMELDGFGEQSNAMKYILLKEGSFFDYFNKAQTDSILQWAEKEMNMDEKSFRLLFSKMKPFAVTQLTIQKEFGSNAKSYELAFEQIAKDEGVTIVGLETVEEQMALFDSFSPAEQTAMVMETIREGEEAVKLLRQMQQVYLSQDIDSLYAIIHADKGIISEKEDDFLKERNEKWIPKIEEFIRQKRTFIAVGAGHLGGPDGLIRLLEQKGYTLTPVEL